MLFSPMPNAMKKNWIMSGLYCQQPLNRAFG